MSMPNEQVLQRLVRRSQVTALIALFVLLALFIYGSYRVYEVEQRVKADQTYLDSLEQQKKQLENNVHTLIAVANSISQPSNNDLIREITPRAKATPVLDSKDTSGRQIYDFQCWIDVPETVKERIAKVSYEFDDPSFRDKERESLDASNNFTVSYRGWGALHLVRIKVTFKDGIAFPIYFDMATYLFGQG